MTEQANAPVDPIDPEKLDSSSMNETQVKLNKILAAGTFILMDPHTGEIVVTCNPDKALLGVYQLLSVIQGHFVDKIKEHEVKINAMQQKPVSGILVP